MVVALTPSRDLVLCREHKHGPHAVIHTLPAGFIEPGETPEQGARRELLEETGHAAAAFQSGTFLLVPTRTRRSRWRPFRWSARRGYLEDAASTRRVFLGALTGGVESLGRTFPLLARADEMIR